MFIQSLNHQICENFFNDGTYFISTAFNGSGETSKSKSIHTLAMYFDNFTGTVEIQGDLSDQPSSSHSDWFLISPNYSLIQQSLSITRQAYKHLYLKQM